MLDADDRTISQVDPKARVVVSRSSAASTPTDVAAGSRARSGSATASGTGPADTRRACGDWIRRPPSRSGRRSPCRCRTPYFRAGQ